MAELMRDPLTPDERYLLAALAYLNRPSHNRQHMAEKLKLRDALTEKYADILDRKYAQWKFPDPDNPTVCIDQRLDVYAADLRERSRGYEPPHKQAEIARAILADRAAQAERMARLEEALSKMRAAVTWISAPFVDENTSHEELRKRVILCVSDAALADRALPQEGSEPS